MLNLYRMIGIVALILLSSTIYAVDDVDIAINIPGSISDTKAGSGATVP